MDMTIARSLWLPVIFGGLVSAQGATCYNAFGTALIYDVEACDLSVSGTAGSHSACCNVPKQDVCLSSGLCLATWATGRDTMLWVGGCTDPTWQDPACWNHCVVGDAGDQATGYSLTSCSNNTWCCDGHFNYQANEGSQGDCCQKAFTLSEGIGTAVRQITTNAGTTTRSSTGSSAASPTSPNPTTNGGNGPAATCVPNSSAGAASSTGDGSNSKTVAIVGGVLGAVLAASLVAVGVLAFSNWRLRRQIHGAAVAGTATTSTGGYDESKPSPPIRHGWPGIPHTATELSATDRTPELDASHRGALRAR
ncbi:hypothetical protein QBC37DRAFT_428961 [Rhypophila decipiens]|uniref:Uncharacterized protein n=1 Tax=Rhypophila decipiens TaxID=261697 RepID=A0AAN7B525_9PEZI|nr:hypothetical protein QBC37DRAFT_428961 [Rhypophila decipiens]